MATGFDWRTDEELGEDQDQSIAPVPHSRFRRFLSVLLLLSLVTLLTLLLLFRQLKTQIVIPITNQTEADVLAAHTLLLDAAARQDADLFRGQLDAQNGAVDWAHTRTLMMRQGNWPGWATFGLRWIGPAAEPVILLSADLTQATIRQRQRFDYAINPQDEVQEIILEQTYSYRHTLTGWKLTPIPTSEQQAWQTHASPLAAFIYPVAEAEFSLHLAKEVRDRVSQFCTLVSCDTLPLFTVYLEANPTELASVFVSDYWAGWSVRPDLTLPSPATLGSPVNEQSETILRLLYTQVVMGYLSSRLAQWPSTSFILTPTNAATLWHIQSALITMGLRQPLAAATVRLLDWHPTNWPDNPLVLVCPSEETTVYQFNALEGTWQGLFSRPSLHAVYPAGTGLMLIDRPAPGVEQVSWWQDQQIQLLGPNTVTDAGVYASAFASTTPLANTLLLYLGNNETETYRHFLVNTQQCDENECARQRLVGQPIWSPNGQRTLIRLPGRISAFYLGDARARPLTLLGMGQNPFWVDDQTIAYIRVPTSDSSVLFSPSHHLVLLNPENPDEVTRITTQQLWATLAEEPDDLLSIRGAVPTGKGQVVIDALTAGAWGGATSLYRFLYTPTTGTLEPVPIFVPEVRFLPGEGQWLAVSEMTFSPLDFFTSPQEPWTLQLQQDWTGQTITFTVPASGYLPYYLPLSPATDDGQWLALLYDQSLVVWSPAQNVTYNLPTPEPNCNNVLWLAPPSTQHE